MIPKTIHYVWFGGGEFSELQLHCIDSWKKYLPEYELIRWDESNFDICMNRYCKEASEERKWAFVSDYVRLWALVNYGGIYMDTDVEILAPLDRFLEHEAFSGFESDTQIPTGLMAAEANQPLFEELLADYDSRIFRNENGSLNLTTNVVYITETCNKYGFIANNQFQVVKGFALYPNDYFCPKSHQTGEIQITGNTYAIHHFDGSWLPDDQKGLSRAKQDIKRKHPNLPTGIVKILSWILYLWKTKNYKALTSRINIKFKPR